MNPRVVNLVKRLAQPQVSLRLRREEMCLSLGAMGKVLCAPDIAGVQTTMLRQRLHQILPACSAREVALVSGGVAAMGWSDAAMVDAVFAHGAASKCSTLEELTALLTVGAAATPAVPSLGALQTASRLAAMPADAKANPLVACEALLGLCIVDSDACGRAANLWSAAVRCPPTDPAAGMAVAACLLLALRKGGGSVPPAAIEKLLQVPESATRDLLRLAAAAAKACGRPEDAVRLRDAAAQSPAESSDALLRGLAAVARALDAADSSSSGQSAPLHPLASAFASVLHGSLSDPAMASRLSAAVDVLQPAAQVELSTMRAAVIGFCVAVTNSTADLINALETSSRCGIRDTFVFERLGTAVRVAVEKSARDRDTLGRLLAAVGPLPLDEVRSLVSAAIKASADGAAQSEDAEKSLPQRLRRMREAGEPVSDAVLMEALESAEAFSIDEVADIVFAAPARCAEMESVVERLKEGMSSLGPSAVASLLLAFPHSAVLAAVLQEDALAQAAELAGTVSSADAPRLLKGFAALLAADSSGSGADGSILHEAIGAVTDRFVQDVTFADLPTICAFLGAFNADTPLSRDTLDACCKALTRHVPTASSTDLAMVIKALAEVDVAPPALMDALAARLHALTNAAEADGWATEALFGAASVIGAAVALDAAELDSEFQRLVRVVAAHVDRLDSVCATQLLRAAAFLGLGEVVASAARRIETGLSDVREHELGPILHTICAAGRLASPDLANALLVRTGALLSASHDAAVDIPLLLRSCSALLSLEAPQLDVPESLLAALVERVDSFSGPEAADIVAALPLLAVSGADTATQAIVTRLGQTCEECPPAPLAAAVFALGELGVGSHISHHIAVDRLSEHCVDTAQAWHSGSAICRLLYGFSRAGCIKRSVYNVFGSLLVRRPILHTLRRADISLAMSALGTAKFLDKELYDALAVRMTAMSTELNAADVTLALTGYTRMNLLNEGLYTSLGDRVVELAEEIPTDSAARILIGYGHVGHHHEALTAAVVKKVAADPNLDVSTTIRTMYAACQIGHDWDEDEVRQLTASITENVELAGNDDIRQLCEVVLELDWRDERLLRATADRASQLLEESNGPQPETCRLLLDTMAHFRIHHPEARLALTPSARTVSRDPSVTAEIEGRPSEEAMRLASE